MIRVQEEPFDIAAELKSLTRGNHDIGGSVCFIGTVRDMSGGAAVKTMTLEHYPGMTEKALAEIEREANERWALQASLIVHRYGPLEPGDDIVLVIASAPHRQDAFDACQFLIDWLKTKAPFWKCESDGQTENWVDARESDDMATARWGEKAAD